MARGAPRGQGKRDLTSPMVDFTMGRKTTLTIPQDCCGLVLDARKLRLVQELGTGLEGMEWGLH